MKACVLVQKRVPPKWARARRCVRAARARRGQALLRELWYTTEWAYWSRVTAYVMPAMNPPKQVSSSSSSICLAMTSPKAVQQKSQNSAHRSPRAASRSTRFREGASVSGPARPCSTMPFCSGQFPCAKSTWHRTPRARPCVPHPRAQWRTSGSKLRGVGPFSIRTVPLRFRREPLREPAF